MENELLFKIKDIETNIKAIRKTIEKCGDVHAVHLACIKYHDSMIALAQAVKRQSALMASLIDMIARQ